MSFFEIVEDLHRIDFTAVHEWLAHSYWSPGISLEKVKQGAENSALVVSARETSTGRSLGYARVISDTTRFAYLADVFVDPNFRKRGIAQCMIKHCIEHPKFAEVSRWCLLTQDAQKLYEKLGFRVFEFPERFMTFKKN